MAKVWRSVVAVTGIRLRRARLARLAITVWIVRTGAAVSRPLGGQRDTE